MDARAHCGEGEKGHAESHRVGVDRHVARPDDRLFPAPGSFWHGYFLSASSLLASSCLALLMSSSSLSKASGLIFWPETRGRRTFTSRRRTPSISARDTS